MDDLSSLDVQHGLKGILVSLIALIAAQVASYLVKGVWAFVQRNKGPTRDQFTELTKALKENTQELMDQKMIISKMSLDMRRIYVFLKVIAGDKWREYRQQVEDIEKEENLN